MRWIFELVQNYGLALLLFTILSRLVMIPLTIKQTKSSAKMAIVQPEIQEIQRKYAGNRQKINEEMMALYGKVGYNPTAGCLPMLVQMVILFGIIDVIFRPMTHILNLTASVIDRANDITTWLIAEGLMDASARAQQSIELATLYAIDGGLVEYFHEIGPTYITSMQTFAGQMHFLGTFNLMDTPSLEMNALILIPILSGVTSVLLTMATMGQMGAQAPGMPNMKIMMWMMPVFSTVFTFMIPAGVGIYWIYANVIGYIQAKILKIFYNPKEMAEKHRAQMEEIKERERQERKAAKERAKERGETDDIESMSKKEQNRRRLAEARKRDAEKYGDSYHEDDD